MARTAQFNLPLVMPSQAQKHVTVNEALVRLDAVAQLRVKSTTAANPPVTGADGEAYLIPTEATGAWLGRAGEIAIWNNGGWIYLPAKQGWQAWDEARSTRVFHDGKTWQHDVVACSAGGATTANFILEFDHLMSSGVQNTTAVTIPAGVQVLGVTGRVIQSITGAGITGWKLGVAESENRYASGIGTAAGSYMIGLSGSPVTYYSGTPLLLTAENGTFTSGAIRFAIHAARLTPPKAP